MLPVGVQEVPGLHPGLAKRGVSPGEPEQSDQLCGLHRKLWRGEAVQTGEKKYFAKSPSSCLPSSTWRQKPLSVKREAGWPRTPEPIKSFVFVWGGVRGSGGSVRKIPKQIFLCALSGSPRGRGALGSASLTEDVATPPPQSHQPEKSEVGEGVALAAHVSGSLWEQREVSSPRDQCLGAGKGALGLEVGVCLSPPELSALHFVQRREAPSLG